MRAPTDTPARLSSTSHPVLYEVNTRILTYELSRRLGREATLDDVPDDLLDEWAGIGFDAVWLMGVWTTGAMGRSLALAYVGLHAEYRRILPDFTPDDVVGSPYAVQAYAVSPALGGDAAIARLRKRLRQRGLGLILDFVCNHTARDHAWVSGHPEFYVLGKAGRKRRNRSSSSAPPRSGESAPSPSGAIRISPDGPIPRSSTMSAPTCVRRSPASCGASPGCAMACAATWRC